MKNFSLDKWPERFANMCPKLRKSFSTNTMKPMSTPTPFRESTFESAIVWVETDLT
jgi:hypothetical protein